MYSLDNVGRAMLLPQQSVTMVSLFEVIIYNLSKWRQSLSDDW